MPWLSGLVGMPVALRPTFWSPRRHRLCVVALVAFGVMAAGWDANASSISAASASEEGDHAHSCRCGPRCRGASCCCGPAKPKRVARTVTPPSVPSAITTERGDSGPCLAAAPCGDPAVPTGAFVGPIAKAIPFLRSRDLQTLEKGRLIAVPTSVRRPARLASRLERPPRADTPA